MKKLIPLLVMALASVSLAKVPEAVLAARKSAVQIIEREMLPGGVPSYRAICSGAVVELERGPRVISAGHCVSRPANDAKPGTGHYLALDHQGRRWPLKLEEWKFSWPTADHAVFTSAATYLLPALKVAGRKCEIGNDVYSWSGPLGLGLMLFQGQLSGYLSAPTEPEFDKALGNMPYSSNLLVDGGASGSSVLDENGDVVGLLVGGFDTSVKLSGSFFSPVPR